jgi:hypothetical protein
MANRHDQISTIDSLMYVITLGPAPQDALLANQSDAAER